MVGIPTPAAVLVSSDVGRCREVQAVKWNCPTCAAPASPPSPPPCWSGTCPGKRCLIMREENMKIYTWKISNFKLHKSMENGDRYMLSCHTV